MTLEDVKSGQTARVVRVGGGGPIRRRLLDMGIRAGEIIEMVKSAPLKDPLEISLNNGHMSIRRSEAALISVELLPES